MSKMLSIQVMPSENCLMTHMMKKKMKMTRLQIKNASKSHLNSKFGGL